MNDGEILGICLGVPFGLIILLTIAGIITWYASKDDNEEEKTNDDQTVTSQSKPSFKYVINKYSLLTPEQITKDSVNSFFEQLQKLDLTTISIEDRHLIDQTEGRLLYYIHQIEEKKEETTK